MSLFSSSKLKFKKFTCAKRKKSQISGNFVSTSALFGVANSFADSTGQSNSLKSQTIFQFQNTQNSNFKRLIFADVSWISPYSHEQEILLDTGGIGILDPSQFCGCEELGCIHSWEKSYKKYITIDQSGSTRYFNKTKSKVMISRLKSKISLFQENLKKFLENSKLMGKDNVFTKAQQQCKEILVKAQNLKNEDLGIEIHEWNLLMEQFFTLNR